jgi:fanconi anemia group D2 protein
MSNASSVDLSINIADLVMHPTEIAFESITLLTPTLNLMRSLHLTLRKGSLESINAVLGCAVVVPELLGTDDAFDIFDIYTQDLATKLLDCHFHVANWYRVLISAFVFVRSTAVGQIRQKVKHRLTELIKIEETIRTLLKLAPASYTPPICQFLVGPSKETRACGATTFKRPADPKPTTSAKRRRKANTEAPLSDADNLAVLNASTSNLDADARIVSKTYASLHGSKEIYRQLDIDIMYLLEETLELVSPLPNEKIGEVLGLQEMRFLLNDLVEKFETATGVKRHGHQVIVGTPALMIEDLVRLLPKLMGFLDQFTGHLKGLLKTTAGILNHKDFFSEDVIYTKICFSLCLRLLCALFSWSDFEDEANEKLLKESLSYMVKESIFSPIEDQTVRSAALSAVQSLKNNRHLALDITSAVEMYRLSRAVAKHAGDEDADKLSSALCESFLSRTWYSLTGADERGAQFNVALEELVQGLVKGASLEVIRKHTVWLKAEIGQLEAKNGILSTFPCFGKANVPILYCGLSQALIAAILESVASVLHSMRQLSMWEQAVEILNDLLDIVEMVKIPKNFHRFLKVCVLGITLELRLLSFKVLFWFK